MTRRTLRVNALLREELSRLLTLELKDPRIRGFVTITEVETSSDLRHAKVFVSVMGQKEDKQDALEGLAAAQGFLRRELKERLSMKIIPELSFIKDDSLEQGAYLSNLIQRVTHGTPEPPDDKSSSPSG